MSTIRIVFRSLAALVGSAMCCLPANASLNMDVVPYKAQQLGTGSGVRVSELDVLTVGVSDGELVATAIAPPATMATIASGPTMASILRDIMLLPPSLASPR